MITALSRASSFAIHVAVTLPYAKIGAVTLLAGAGVCLLTRDRHKRVHDTAAIIVAVAGSLFLGLPGAFLVAYGYRRYCCYQENRQQRRLDEAVEEVAGRIIQKRHPQGPWQLDKGQIGLLSSCELLSTSGLYQRALKREPREDERIDLDFSDMPLPVFRKMIAGDPFVHVRSLDLANIQITADDLQAIQKKFPHLEELNLAGIATDDLVQQAANLFPNLKELHLHYSPKLTDHVFIALSRFNNLEWLNLSGNKLKNWFVDVRQYDEARNSLQIVPDPVIGIIHDYMEPEIVSLPKLKMLEIANTDITHEDLGRMIAGTEWLRENIEGINIARNKKLTKLPDNIVRLKKIVQKVGDVDIWDLREIICDGGGIVWRSGGTPRRFGGQGIYCLDCYFTMMTAENFISLVASVDPEDPARLTTRPLSAEFTLRLQGWPELDMYDVLGQEEDIRYKLCWSRRRPERPPQ